MLDVREFGLMRHLYILAHSHLTPDIILYEIKIYNHVPAKRHMLLLVAGHLSTSSAPHIIFEALSF